ncbi:20282_t:CDS:2 [Dentiscutata erythropus]|uniref:20282_t:CDS:1 n=1 Tax=Dentiscutata erythropus TaxID=1348616 RepID=A0A9N9NUK0_9GLOM|nr:20282_t:CDS:2 [Dentiscutata erythropus]
MESEELFGELFSNIAVYDDNITGSFEELFSNIAVHDNNAIGSFEDLFSKIAVCDDNSTGPFESDIAVYDNSSNKTINAPFAGQEFCSWDDLDRFILFYTKSQNFVSVICGSEYSDRICRNRQYACEHQGHSSTNKISIAKNQRKHVANVLDVGGKFKLVTEVGNINMRTQYQMLQNHVDCEAATLLNNLLERKAEDNR